MKINTRLLGAIMVFSVLGSTTSFAGTTTTQSTTTKTQFSHSHNGGGGFFSDLPKILGISQATLNAELKSGKTIAQIAQSKGISQKTLIAKLTAAQKTRLDSQVKAGKMTSVKEKQILSNLSKMLTKMVNQKGGFQHRHHQSN